MSHLKTFAVVVACIGIFSAGFVPGYLVGSNAKTIYHSHFVSYIDLGTTPKPKNRVNIPEKPVAYTNDEFSCLARTIYFEAGNQSYEGKLAVGNVVMNRVESEKYPNTICEVVRQYKQFSWYEKFKDVEPYKGKNWDDSIRAAKQVLETGPMFIAGDIHHYHADYVSPSWAKEMTRVAQIDDHIFYR